MVANPSSAGMLVLAWPGLFFAPEVVPFAATMLCLYLPEFAMLFLKCIISFLMPVSLEIL